MRTHTFSPSVIGALHSGPQSTCTNHPRARYQTTRDSCMPPSLSKLLKLANPKPASCALPVPSNGNSMKTLALQFSPLLPLSPDQPWCFPVWPCLVWQPSLPKNWASSIFFQGQSSPLALLCPKFPMKTLCSRQVVTLALGL